jgi:hypothetical protein
MIGKLLTEGQRKLEEGKLGSFLKTRLKPETEKN